MDKLTKDILKNSYLEITNPDFNQTTMKRILHESRKQRILENFLLSFVVFVAVDALILLFLWLLGLNVFDVALRSGSISQELLLHIMKLKDAILHYGFMKYIFLLLILMAIVYGMTESKLNYLERPKHRGN
jgi:Na+/proline symporter